MPRNRSWARPAEPSPQAQASRPPQSFGPQKRSWARPQESVPSNGPRISDLPEPIRARAVRDRQQQQGRRGPQQNQPSSSKGKEVPDSALGKILRTERIQEVSKALAEGEILEGKEEKAENWTSARKASVSAWTPISDADEGFGSRQRNKRTYKERGSLISRHSEEVAIPKYSRASNARTNTKEKEKVQKAPKAVKPANVDVFIPSVVSVGNLAKLLNVTLGMCGPSFSVKDNEFISAYRQAAS